MHDDEATKPLLAAPAQRRQRQSDEAFQWVHQEILTCRLPPGMLVSEAQLSLLGGFSRVAMRTACDRLAQAGLLRPLPRQGYQVAPIRLRDLKNSFELRLLLEPAAARAAAPRIDVERLRAIDARCARGYAPDEPGTISNMLKANTAFHMCIAEASGNERLALVVGDLLHDQERLFHAGFGALDGRTGMRHQHEELLAAFARRDAAAAERCAREHVVTAQRVMMEGLMNSPSLLDIALVPPSVATHG